MYKDELFARLIPLTPRRFAVDPTYRDFATESPPAIVTEPVEVEVESVVFVDIVKPEILVVDKLDVPETVNDVAFVTWRLDVPPTYKVLEIPTPPAIVTEPVEVEDESVVFVDIVKPEILVVDKLDDPETVNDVAFVT